MAFLDRRCNGGVNLLCKYPVGLVIMRSPSLAHQLKGTVKDAHRRSECWVGCCRFSMSVDSMRSPGVLERQSSGVVKDVQKSAQAGIGMLSSHLPALLNYWPDLAEAKRPEAKRPEACASTNMHLAHCVDPASPGLASASPSLASASPGLASASPGLASASPGLASASPGLASASPGLASASPV